MLAHRELGARNAVVLNQLGALQDVGPGLAQIDDVDIGKARLQGLLDKNLRLEKITPQLGYGVELGGGQFDALVFQQPAYQFGAGIFSFLTRCGFAWRQQHARLDFNQHRGHQQVFGGEFQIAAANLFDIDQVLARDAGHWNVQDVEVLLADQVEQQVERTFEGFEKNFQCVGRDVEILRHGEQRFAIESCHRHVVDSNGRAGQVQLRGRLQRVEVNAHSH